MESVFLNHKKLIYILLYSQRKFSLRLLFKLECIKINEVVRVKK